MDGVTLPDADWRTRPGLRELAAALGADDARFVGGAVRDTLLGLPVSDVDIATRHDPDRVMATLRSAGIKPIPTGIAHGTITAITEGGPVEVTTLRRDVSTDGRHAKVAFTDDWREDAARRDFTMNALYADPQTGEIFDYFGGLDDLKAGRVRFIGDPLGRIAEDHLRILRFFRFMARFGDTPDEAGLEACVARANDLMALSRERIADEFLKLLVARDAVRVLRLMVSRGVLLPVLPEVSEDGIDWLERLTLREAALGFDPDAIRRLIAVGPSDPAKADGVAARLKLSNAHRKRIAAAIGDASEAPRPLAFRIGKHAAIDRLLLADIEERDAAARMAEIRDWDVPTLPVSGGEIVARGIQAGPDVAKLLGQVRDQWVAEGFPDTSRAREIADVTVDQWLRETSKS
jgi:poly(A) polymerase